MTTHDLAQQMRSFVLARTESIITRYWASLTIPGFFAGFRIDDTFAIDVADVVTKLHDAGVHQVGTRSSVEIVRTILTQIDGPQTETFFSYRVAEILLAWGGMDQDCNPVLRGLRPDQMDNLIQAVDSTHIYHQWDKPLGGRPNNYWGVLARCEHGRKRLGLPTDDAIYSDCIKHIVNLVEHNPLGYFDDDMRHGGRYDIYSADIVLFLQPLWDQIGLEKMRHALGRHVALLETIAHRDSGASVAWGRSVGAHSVAMTIELASAGIAEGMGADPSRLAGLADRAFAIFRDRWIADELTSAHRGAMTSGYRAPHRLLQMTFDLYGKLLYAATELLGVPAVPIQTDQSILFPATDAFVPFESDRAVGVWALRNRHWDFQLPLVANPRSHYGAFPHAPDTLDVPVDSVMFCGSPRVVVDGIEYASAGVPDHVEHRPGQLKAIYNTFAPINVKAEAPPLAARREVRWRVENRAIVIDEDWTFPSAPSAIYYMIPESQRPLAVQFDSDTPHDASVVEVSGMPTMRGYFGPIARLHQINFCRLDSNVRLTTTICPSIRVAHVPADHDYNRGIYDAMPIGAVTEVKRHGNGLSPHALMSADDFAGNADIVHLGWFEHLLSRQLMDYPALIERVVLLTTRLRQAGKKIVWTMHNRRPHSWSPEDGGALYRAVAPLVDAAIHHSQWGMKLMQSELPYRADCLHAVIPHGHFGAQMQIDATRETLEQKYDLKPCAIRFGVLGRYQPEKQIELIIRAFRRAKRPDQQLVLTAYKEGIDLGDAGDARIVRLPRDQWMLREQIAEHNKVCDALVTAHTGDTYLTSGIAADAIGLGLAMVCPAWAYFREIVSDAAIEYDGSEQSLCDFFASVTPEQIHQAQCATAPLREAYAFDRVAKQHLALFESLVS